MQLLRQLAVGLFDLVGAGAASDPEKLVGVPHGQALKFVMGWGARCMTGTLPYCRAAPRGPPRQLRLKRPEVTETCPKKRRARANRAAWAAGTMEISRIVTS